MEAGYDYTLLGGRPRGSGKYLPALFVALLAGVLLVSGLAYYGFASDARADLASVAGVETGSNSDGSDADGSTNGAKYTRYLSPASAEEIAGQQLYPAGFSEAEYWVNPLGYEQ